LSRPFSVDFNFEVGFLCPGAESSWPHACGRRPVSEPSFASTHTLPAAVSCKSLAWASDSTVAAVLRTRTSQALRSSMTPSTLSSIGSSTSLQSQSQMQVPGHMSAVPVSWQVRLAPPPLHSALHNWQAISFQLDFGLPCSRHDTPHCDNMHTECPLLWPCQKV